MDKWEEFTLGDLIDIRHGYAFKGEYFKDRPPGDILLTPGNFAVGGGFQFNKLKYYDGPGVSDFTLKGGELLVTMTDLSKAGDTLGFPAIVPKESRTFLHNQRLGKVIMKSAEVSQDFVYWLMRTTPYRNEVLGSCTGSTVKHTSPKRIQAHRFPLPPKSERKSIVETLSALDNKIELNRRINETLEAMARAVFKDWFVDFGPTRRKAAGTTDSAQILGGLLPDPTKAAPLAALFPNIYGEDGLPEGWEEGSLADWAVEAAKSIAPSEIDPTTPYIGLEHLPRGSISLAQWETAQKVTSNKSRFSKGQTLFGKLRPYFHKTGIAPIDGICSTDIVVLDGKEEAFRPFVTTVVSTEEFVAFATQTSIGTKMPRTKWPTMKEFSVANSGMELVLEFCKLVAPMHELILGNVHESQTLAATRDLLLPKLMSGEIRLKDAEGAI